MSESSLRRYIDITTAVDLGRRLRHANLSGAIHEAKRRLLEYFPEGCFGNDVPRRRAAAACRPLVGGEWGDNSSVRPQQRGRRLILAEGWPR